MIMKQVIFYKSVTKLTKIKIKIISRKTNGLGWDLIE